MQQQQPMMNQFQTGQSQMRQPDPFFMGGATAPVSTFGTMVAAQSRYQKPAGPLISGDTDPNMPSFLKLKTQVNVNQPKAVALDDLKNFNAGSFSLGEPVQNQRNQAGRNPFDNTYMGAQQNDYGYGQNQPDAGLKEFEDLFEIGKEKIKPKDNKKKLADHEYRPIAMDNSNFNYSAAA